MLASWALRRQRTPHARGPTRSPAALRPLSSRSPRHVESRTVQSNPGSAARSSAAARRALVGILLVAAAVRLAALFEVRDIGFFRQPMSDGRVYVERAGQIVAGDWLGPASFVHAPLYAYFLALVGGPVGDYVYAPRVAQVALGVALVYLVFELGRRWFSAAAGLVAATLVALYPPAIFFDLLIQKAGLTLLLSALVLLAASWAARAERPRWTRWAAAGGALGLLILNRQNALVYLPLLIAWAWVATPASRRPTAPSGAGSGRARSSRAERSGALPPPHVARLGAAAAIVAACLLVLAPWVVRNRVVLGEWVLTTPNVGQNFAMGNAPAATGTYLPLRRGVGTGEIEQAAWTREAERALGRELSAGEVSDYYLARSLEWVRANPLDFLALTARKLLLTWGAYELPDTEDYYLYLEHARVLRWLDRVWHFGLLAPLAAAGAVLAAGPSRRLWPLYAWLVLTTLSVALFVVFARYRLPLLPALFPLAGGALVALADALRRRTPVPAGRWAAAVGTAALVAALSNWPLHAPRQPRAMSYCNHAVALADAGRTGEALRELHRALTLSPDLVDAHLTLGSVLLEQGRHEDALRAYARARDGDPSDPAAWRGIGDALAALGRLDEALSCFGRAVELDPTDRRSRNSLAGALGRLGRLDEAREALQRLVADEPDFAEAHLNLGNALLALGRVDEAAAAYDRALAIRAGYVDALFNRGVLELQRSRPREAAEFFQALLARRPEHAEAQRALVEALVSDGRAPEARELLEAWLRRWPERADLRALRARFPGS